MTSNSYRTYKQARNELAALQQEAEELRRREAQIVLSEIREKISEYGFSEKEISALFRPARHSPKYMDPETGSTWSGRGRPPAWIAKSENWDRFLIEKI
ncbi:Histone family protein nucleoid-structuring protein H-NS [Burkholderia gladioli]|uniref:H-NS histone family protein n=1 Tax=Burkholderia gladioli TaxID=28095 RepID=UPI001CB13048|nr:H-NS histone family protein [Burkholderia gladioli]CAG9235861.1 Histone family protein nucleoid-structuring protein H-NS [Burkholderia gladioli]